MTFLSTPLQSVYLRLHTLDICRIGDPNKRQHISHISGLISKCLSIYMHAYFHLLHSNLSHIYLLDFRAISVASKDFKSSKLIMYVEKWQNLITISHPAKPFSTSHGCNAMHMPAHRIQIRFHPI